MERHLKAEVREQTGKSETHLSHSEKWFSSSTSLFKKIAGSRRVTKIERKGDDSGNCINIRGTTSRVHWMHLIPNAICHTVLCAGMRDSSTAL
jgi:hypothetical protein